MDKFRKGNPAMAVTDYDAPRTSVAQPETESLDLLHERRAVPVPDLDDSAVDDYELPGFEILDEELSAPVVPMREDEFRCGGCFLVLHQSLRAARANAEVCRDCS